MKEITLPEYICGLSIVFLSLFCSTVFSEDAIAINPFDMTSINPQEMTLLNHGLGSLEKRLEIIERAEKYIDVEYFIYRVDTSAKIFTQALVKKARQGVKVRMLVDYFMVKNELSPFYAHELEKAGIELKYFNKTNALSLLFSGQYRNHRKVLLVDGKEVITGGRNIGDEYFDLHPDYNFLDRDVYVKGDVVQSISKTFDETYASSLSERLPREKMPNPRDLWYKKDRGGFDSAKYNQDLKRWKKNVAEAEYFLSGSITTSVQDRIREKGKEELASEFSGTCGQMSFQSEYPNLNAESRKTNRVIKHDIFERIKNAKKSIVMDSPYFIVNNELGKALDTAFNKKIDVKLLTNSLNSTDAIYVYAAFDTIAAKWLEKGLDSYIYKGERPDSYDVLEGQQNGNARFGVHAKTFVFDDKDVIIGTYNVDPRSANYNSEMIITCENNPEFAQAVRSDIDVRMNESIRLDSKKAIKDAEFYQIGFGKKLLYYFTKIPANAFRYLL